MTIHAFLKVACSGIKKRNMLLPDLAGVTRRVFGRSDPETVLSKTPELPAKQPLRVYARQ
jgi:hypothetical protein